ncbi:MAG: amidohydrolase family protein [Nitrososphaerota archaeon]|nr:amidohydrolase family protein [Nitrososphaerota archaeon]
MDLVVRNARVPDGGGTVDIGVEGGAIVAVKPSVPGRGETEIDAGGCLVLPSFVEPHVHLDKAFLAERMPESKTIQEARERIREAKKGFTAEDIAARARRALRLAVAGGVTFVRTHVDVDGTSGLTGVRALAKVKKEFEGVVDLQVVAFPQEGILRSPGVSELLARALEEGADLLGGIPETETSQESMDAHTDLVTKMSSELGVDVDCHCDVNPATAAVERFAERVGALGLGGRATASHLISLAYMDDARAAATIGLIRRAGLNVVTNPCTAMVSGFTKAPPLGRGVTRIKELLRAGVNVSYGLDNLVDPYNPFGDFDPLRNGWLLAYEGQLNSSEDFASVLRMDTYNAARTMRLEGYGLSPGGRADFNVLDAETPRECLRRRTVARFVVKKGAVLYENEVSSVPGPSAPASWSRPVP